MFPKEFEIRDDSQTRKQDEVEIEDIAGIAKKEMQDKTDGIGKKIVIAESPLIRKPV